MALVILFIATKSIVLMVDRATTGKENSMFAVIRTKTRLSSNSGSHVSDSLIERPVITSQKRIAGEYRSALKIQAPASLTQAHRFVCTLWWQTEMRKDA